ncbi:MAG: YlxR family protein [Lachnospiraceae bacterium]|nr:YlxR family protein [Lachnospiraceae bacterium]
MQGKKKPARQCVGCRESKEKKDLIRIVKTPEGDIVLDRTGRQNGRGAYLCDRAECLEKARKTNALSRSFRIPVPEAIYEELERQWKNDTK